MPVYPLEFTKYPFWSAIISQTQGSTSIPAGSQGFVSIQPPSGETWLIDIGCYIESEVSGSYVYYTQYKIPPGSFYPDNVQKIGGTYGDIRPHLHVTRIITNVNYAYLWFNNASASSVNAYFGYSGFKLSKPIWQPQRESSASNWKIPSTTPLPASLQGLEKYVAAIRGLNPLKPDEYVQAIILEEDTPLAVDPDSMFPVERVTKVVKALDLAGLIDKFKAKQVDPVAAGYKHYLDRWRDEGIDLGV